MTDHPLDYCPKPVACVCGTYGEGETTQCYRVRGHNGPCRAWCCDDPYTNPCKPAGVHADPIRVQDAMNAHEFPWVRFKRDHDGS